MADSLQLHKETAPVLFSQAARTFPRYLFMPLGMKLRLSDDAPQKTHHCACQKVPTSLFIGAVSIPASEIRAYDTVISSNSKPYNFIRSF